MNKVIISGYVGKVPEVRYSGETAIANFSLGVNEGKNKDGSSRTIWVNVVAFKGTAQLIEKWITKGSHIMVEGRLDVSSYEKDGKRLYMTKVMASAIEFLDTKDAKKDAPKEVADSPVVGFSMLNDEDIPF